MLVRVWRVGGAASAGYPREAPEKDNFTGYKLLIADVVDGKIKAVPRGVMAAGNVMQGARGGADLPRKLGCWAWR